MPNAFRTGLTVVLSLDVLACGEPAATPASYTTVDSAGVTVVESTTPSWMAEGGLRVGEVAVTVGGDAVDLFQVAGAARLADGGLVVADGGTSRLLFFDGDGDLDAVVGGQGDGPGEFRIIQTLGVAAGDTVWVYDFSHRRMSLYGPGATLVRTFPFEPPLPTAAVVGRWPDGTYALTQLWGDSGGAAIRPGLAREPVVYARYGPDGALLDTLGAFPGREVLLRPEGRRTVMGVAPFARNASHAVLGDGLAVGDQVRHTVRVLDGHGVVRRIVRWEGPSLALKPEEVDAWKEDQIASAAAADRTSVRAYLADVPVPEFKPAYGELLADSEGCLWVAAYAHPGGVPERWDVFDPAGVWLGSVEMPAGFEPLQVGRDWALGMARDELGVERLEMRALVGR